MEKTTLHPEIFLIENFLTNEECDHYIELTKDQVFEEAKINMQGRQVMSKGIRNNDRLMVFDNELAENLYQRAAGFLPQTHGSYKVSGLMKCSGSTNIRPGNGSKCTATEAISGMKMKRAFTLS